MNRVQKYCHGCKANRRFSQGGASTLELWVWFILGCFFLVFWIPWIIRMFGRDYSCDSCGSDKFSNPRED